MEVEDLFYVQHKDRFYIRKNTRPEKSVQTESRCLFLCSWLGPLARDFRSRENQPMTCITVALCRSNDNIFS
jgi:hypothetical protein